MWPVCSWASVLSVQSICWASRGFSWALGPIQVARLYAAAPVCWGGKRLGRGYDSALLFSNNAVPGQLATNLSISATTVWLTGTPVGYPGQYPFTIWVDPGTSAQEAMSVTSGAGTAAQPWVVTRGFDSTLAQAHNATAVVAHELSAYDVATSRSHEASDNTSGTTPHGLPLSAWQAGAFATIQETVLPNSTGTVVTFSAIPQTYSHLLLAIQGRLTISTAKSGEAVCTINGDTAAKYSYLQVEAHALTSINGPNATTANAQTAWNQFIQLPGSQIGSVVNAGGGFAWFPNYAGTTFNKMAIALSGWGNATDANIAGQARWCFYNPTSQAGISSLSVAASQSTFQSGSFFGLYGFG